MNMTPGNGDRSEDLPWIPVAAGVSAKPLRFAASGAGWVSIVRIDPGHAVPMHRHSGEVQGVVLEGRCQYRGESTWLEPGTYVHEADGAEDEIIACPTSGASILFIVQGPRVEYLDAAGIVSHVDDQKSKEASYVTYCTENSLEPASLWH
jgi:hypothetical protein